MNKQSDAQYPSDVSGRSNSRRGRGSYRSRAKTANWRARSSGIPPQHQSAPTMSQADSSVGTSPTVQLAPQIPQAPTTEKTQASRVKAEKETVPTDKPLFHVEGISATHPVTKRYSQNLDFSGLIPLVEQTYDDLRTQDNRLGREMPYCMFQHACVSALHVILFSVLNDVNKDNRFLGLRDAQTWLQGLTLPKIICDYYEQIGTTVTQDGSHVEMNFPERAIPLDGTNNTVAGTFGVCDAASHNLYECYPSPYISRNLIQATIDNDRNWEPLPDALHPADSVPNRILLGYRIPESLDTSGRNALQNLRDPIAGNETAMRAQIIPEVFDRVSAAIKSRAHLIKIGNPVVTQKNSANQVGFVECIIPLAHNTYLVPTSVVLWSPTTLGANQASMLDIFTFKRIRNPGAPGLCYTRTGVAIAGWMDGINSNFNMIGHFAPVTRIDEPTLRIKRYTASTAAGDRIADISDVLLKSYRGRKE